MCFLKPLRKNLCSGASSGFRLRVLFVIALLFPSRFDLSWFDCNGDKTMLVLMGFQCFFEMRIQAG